MTDFSPDTLAIIGTVIATVLGTGLALGIMAWRMASRLDRRTDNDKAAADADRRAWQRTMDDFRKEMLRLAERQSRIEGRIEPAE